MSPEDLRPRFLTTTDVAEILGMSDQSVRNLILRGELKALQVGERRQWRIDPAELDRYIEAQYEQAAAYIAENNNTRLSQP